MENELKDFKERVVVVVQEYIWDILSVTDIELKRSCTTGIESWILGHPTIEMSLNANEWYYSPEHVVGSDIVTSYNELKNTVLEYLHKKPINKNKQEAREKFLNTWCYKIDGKSTARVVKHILQLELGNSLNVPVNFKSWLMYILLRYGNNYIHDIKIYGIGVFYSNKVDKLGRVDKYFKNSDIRNWKIKLKNIQ